LAVQVLVCAVEIEAGRQETLTEVMVGATAETITLVEPVLDVFWVEVAVMLAVPTPDGVKTPPALMVPPVAAHVTAEL
jgi:hypothetical protein